MPASRFIVDSSAAGGCMQRDDGAHGQANQNDSIFAQAVQQFQQVVMFIMPDPADRPGGVAMSAQVVQHNSIAQFLIRN